MITQRDLDGLSTMLKTSLTCNIPKVIVYVPTKNIACKVYTFLKAASTNKKLVGMYHANLTQKTKSSTYYDFLSTTSDTQCLVATIAFGMVNHNRRISI